MRHWPQEMDNSGERQMGQGDRREWEHKECQHAEHDGAEWHRAKCSGTQCCLGIGAEGGAVMMNEGRYTPFLYGLRLSGESREETASRVMAKRMRIDRPKTAWNTSTQFDMLY